MRLSALLALPLLASLASAAGSARALPAPSASGPNLKISFKMRAKELAYAGSFVVQEGAQGNYVDGGELADEVKTRGGPVGVEFHKTAAVVNCVAVQNPNKKAAIRAECQFELSGPTKSTATALAKDIKTLQLQTAFEVTDGKPLAVIDEPERGVEVTIRILP